MEQKILLFDFDGTIADTANSAVKIYNEIARENNYKLITKEGFIMLRNMGPMDAMHYLGVPLLKLPFIVKRGRTALKKEVPNLKVILGIEEPLRLLKDKGYKLFIVSTNTKENIKTFLNRNQIKEFDDIYPVSDIFGKGTEIKRLIAKNGWDKASVMYIGDEVRDIGAAKKAGIISVAVTWGFNTEEILSKNNPDILIKTPSELSSI